LHRTARRSVTRSAIADVLTGARPDISLHTDRAFAAVEPSTVHVFEPAISAQTALRDVQIAAITHRRLDARVCLTAPGAVIAHHAIARLQPITGSLFEVDPAVIARPLTVVARRAGAHGQCVALGRLATAHATHAPFAAALAADAAFATNAALAANTPGAANTTGAADATFAATATGAAHGPTFAATAATAIDEHARVLVAALFGHLGITAQRAQRQTRTQQPA
jgi:hypothetical protein